MAHNITAFTSPGETVEGEVVPFLSINRDDDGQVVVTARDALGQQVAVAIPHDRWFVMARQIFETRGLIQADAH